MQFFRQTEKDMVGEEGSLLVGFEPDFRVNEEATAKEGRTIVDELVFVEIRNAQDKNSVVRRAAEPEDKVRFARAWAAYQAANSSEAITGTPLESVPWLERKDVEELRYFNVRTLENLKGAPKEVVEKFGHRAKNWQQRAQDLMDAASGQAKTDQLRAELEQTKSELEMARAQRDDALAQLEESKKEASHTTTSKKAK